MKLRKMLSNHHARKGDQSAERGNITTAVKHYARAVKLDAAQPARVYAALGTNLIRDRRLEDARRIFRQILERYPEKVPGYAGMARIAMKERSWKHALEWWEKGVSKFPDNFHLNRGKGLTLFELRRFAEAENVFQRLTERHTDRPEVFEYLAQIAQHMGDWMLAAKRWDQCIERFPDMLDSRWYLEKGIALFELGQVEAAVLPGKQRG